MVHHPHVCSFIAPMVIAILGSLGNPKNEGKKGKKKALKDNQFQHWQRVFMDLIDDMCNFSLAW